MSVDRLVRRLLAPSIRGLALALVVLASGLGFIAQMLGNPPAAANHSEALNLTIPPWIGVYSSLAPPPCA